MEPQEAEQPSGAKSNLMKYIMLGGGGLVVVLLIAFGIAFMLKGKKGAETETPAQQASATESHPSAPSTSHADSSATTDFDTMAALSDSDPAAIDKIMDNLSFLDYQPDSNEVAQGREEMLVEDSLREANWIKMKKDSLAVWENTLNERQKSLDKQQQDVDRKMLVLEQAEVARVAQLAKLYDGMDSRAVARLMANLDDETVVAILPKMKVKNASEVLQLLPAQRAAKLSKQLITIAEN